MNAVERVWVFFVPPARFLVDPLRLEAGSHGVLILSARSFLGKP